MRRSLFLIVVVVAMYHATNAFSADVVKTEKIEKTFRFKDPKGKNLLVVDNVFGSIEVTGYNGEDVVVKAEKIIRAKSDRKVEEAQEEVYLDIAEEDDLIELYVDGPFRDHNGRGRSRSWRGFERSGWEVCFNFQIKVPVGTHLEISTVNDGEISVTKIDGDYEIHNVNGGIMMDEIGGSGDVYTVNGDVTVDFTKNPEGESRFGSLNGEVRLYFQPKLSADFYLKTFNGQVFSDFEVTYLAPKVTTMNEKNGKRVYKSGHLCGVRAGSGGPEIKLDGFNGDMFILRK
ncbi:MAG: hypothetical protein ABIL68_00265 [bacterium]